MIEGNRYRFTVYLPLAWAFAALAYFAGSRALNANWHSLTGVFLTGLPLTCTTLASVGFSLLLARLAYLPIAKLHTPISALVHYICNLAIYAAGYWARRDWQKATSSVRATQEKLLAKHLLANSSTEFGRKFNFASIKNREEFRETVPLSTFSDYQGYIERIEKGENNLLTQARVERLSVSSGTTGKCKHLPFTKHTLSGFLWGFLMPFLHRVTEKRPNLAPLKNLELHFVPKWRYSQCGLCIGPATGSPGRPPYFVGLGRATPPEAQALMPEPGQTYLHLYYALSDRNIHWVGSSFAGTLVSGFDVLLKEWKQLASDIRNGRISNYDNMIPSDVLRGLKPFAPDPVRAQEIENEFSAGFDGILKRLWPKVDFIVCVATGSHAIFRERLQRLAGPEIKILSSVYGASESSVGVAMTDKQDIDMSYTILPSWSFFEFISEEEMDKPEPTTLFLEQLEVGQRYELVVTSTSGFYRYRLQDIVRVVEFHNQAPVIEFCARKGSILDVRGEKTTEDMVFQALQQAKWPEQCRVLDYTTTDSLSWANACHDDDNSANSANLFYVVFIELDKLQRGLNDDETAAFDDALAAISYPYKSFRIKDAIRSPKIFVVEPGTFQEAKEFILQRNGAISNQYKTPRYTKDPALLQLIYKRAY